MLNETDKNRDAPNQCRIALNKIKPDPGDYYNGLPTPSLTLPKNILLFSRKRSQAPGFEFTHHHHRFLLIACFKGSGGMMVNDELIELTPGDILFIPPYQFHAYNYFKDPELAWIFVSFELCENDALGLPEAYIMKMSPLMIASIQRVMEDYPDCKNMDNSCAEITLLVAILLENIRNQPSSKQKKSKNKLRPDQEFIRSITHYITKHISEPILISDIAKATGHSESSLRTKFRTYSGIPLGTYIRRLRIQHARSIILTTNGSLQEIAERCGYDSIYSFSRTFRNEIGIAPSLYRKKGDKMSKLKKPTQ